MNQLQNRSVFHVPSRFIIGLQTVQFSFFNQDLHIHCSNQEQTNKKLLVDEKLKFCIADRSQQLFSHNNIWLNDWIIILLMCIVT